ncbi:MULTISPECIES: SUF system Fe-S cluster assembly protein [Oceanicaulis]|uniref:SUF system Fe-S cluster assembly protein n=1 Tax=Oceanicaulis TaxID=153232 RepID=UPI000ED8E67F|nr:MULTISPECIES: SUF system Fe-S cluster assembly protein [Oceanicaulis]VXC45513.1 SUF system Fe-S cluster assembly protein [Oceanicaulis sp. 350]HCR66654.1 SUF system Fe-S cluster assembly protein [Oceanicaulis sp.]|tara:strand:- start:1523 stop:1969 length:447 start_codon:yes stop_codon:yes gene_type:complete
MDTDNKSSERDMMDLGAAPSMTLDAPTSADAKPTHDAAAESEIPQEEIERITHDVIEALKTVFDPEIPVDIYELGLIYQVDLEPDHSLKVEMTLTAPGCPVAGEMPGWVRDACETVKGVERADVTLTFDPPWTPDRMSDEAKLTLNMF